LQDLIGPGPSEAWVFMDERSDSINDGLFAVDVVSQYALYDIPGSYHNGGASLSFADGHTEYHHWLEPTTNPPMEANQRIRGGSKPTSSTDQDLQWLVMHTTSRK
jgi:prepilin-type processing-associated H-X9-DG protein